MNLELYQKLDLLISQGRTGNSELLAQKIGVCPRTLKNMIKVLRETCGAPVEFSRKDDSYLYTTNGRCFFEYQSSFKETLLSNLYTSIADTIIRTLPVFSILIYALSDSQEPFCFFV